MKADMNKINEITSRYILPTIEERTSYGYIRCPFGVARVVPTSLAR
jgi:hypothetical protein